MNLKYFLYSELLYIEPFSSNFGIVIWFNLYA